MNKISGSLGLILGPTYLYRPSKSVTMWLRLLYKENVQQSLLDKIDGQQSRLFDTTIVDIGKDSTPFLCHDYRKSKIIFHN